MGIADLFEPLLKPLIQRCAERLWERFPFLLPESRRLQFEHLYNQAYLIATRVLNQSITSGDIQQEAFNAIDYLNNAIEIDGSRTQKARAYYWLARLWEYLQFPGTAIRCYELSVKRNPHDPEVLKEYAQFCYAQGNDREALEALRRYRAMAPEDPEAQERLRQWELEARNSIDGRLGWRGTDPKGVSNTPKVHRGGSPRSNPP